MCSAPLDSSPLRDAQPGMDIKPLCQKADISAILNSPLIELKESSISPTATPTPTRLRTLYRERGLTLQAVADLLEVSREAVRSWGAGEAVPHRRSRRGLTAIFGMPAEDILAHETRDGDEARKPRRRQ